MLSAFQMITLPISSHIIFSQLINCGRKAWTAFRHREQNTQVQMLFLTNRSLHSSQKLSCSNVIFFPKTDDTFPTRVLKLKNIHIHIGCLHPSVGAMPTVINPAMPSLSVKLCSVRLCLCSNGGVTRKHNT